MPERQIFNNGKLSKRVPARTKTVEFNWICKDWLEINPRYREIRGKMRSKMDTCFWCGYKFEDGEMLSLGQVSKGPNKILCPDCADKAGGDKEASDG